MKEKEEILEDNQIYEVGFHILSTIPEEKLQEVVSKLEHSITQNGGLIISEEFPKMRILSYEIKKRVETKNVSFNKAYFGWIKFEIEAAVVGKIKEDIANNENVLRFIIIKTVKENTMQAFKSPMLAKENNRDETPKVSKDVSAQTEKVEISEEEIDKSIDELVIDQTL
jgi:ribosomal protein S6